jgi:hypothetical protein
MPTLLTCALEAPTRFFNVSSVADLSLCTLDNAVNMDSMRRGSWLTLSLEIIMMDVAPALV